MILTSFVAVVTCNDELKDGVIVDESWFSYPLYCEEHKVCQLLFSVKLPEEMLAIC